MTRLVVTADAEADLDEILDYLEREAGPRVAEDYGRRFRVCLERHVEFLASGRGDLLLDPIHVSASCGRTF